MQTYYKNKNSKITTLCWFDILTITLIMFSVAIYNSTTQYFALSSGDVSLEENLIFSSYHNYIAILVEVFYLFLLFLYLKFRKFDFSVLFGNIKFSLKAVLQGVLIFLFVAVLMDIYFFIVDIFFELFYTDSDIENLVKFDISIILFALINGFFEEIFFLGICLSVKKEYIKFAFLYSLIIRFSFHTYQGILTALGIGIVLGTAFFVIYKFMKTKNLFVFFIAHSIGDIIGLSMGYFFVLFDLWF
ncbi:CPBP family intramembrane metalloprotease [Campylobacter sp. RM12327]|uniref:CPBP family glutamic-type intramembrane protease n=1 Tax=Campylobacter sputorum TaxID=206 RepID=UPI000B775FF6|nr:MULTISPECIES: CPBP family intramembrane glutamic endopeptidase [Campylobacter]ASM40657.1 hypothetical protein CSPB_1472 [Campylobacter sputorum]MBE7357678.1 CPBP family intramembrane metalloprotease [Campylobacter sp. RM11302]MBF6668956.1 CPBP family intramembrane metalloprotease [Campylobacter sp. RM12327]MBF6674035.1 CPBP family intramembrane metalloprotease [Campylobacter sp. RM13538]MBF6675938.1 CPBP family intramembrane metalloprotease [Campylobacter sp. RM12321]